MVGGHGGVAHFPIHRADLAELFEVLERINHAQALTNRTAQRHIIDDLVADDAGEVDEEQSTIGNEFTGDADHAIVIDGALAGEHIVGLGDGFVDISDEREGLNHANQTE